MEFTILKNGKAPNGYQLSNRVIQLEINDEGTFIDGELLEENDSVCEFIFYNKQIPKIQTGIETNRTLIIASAIISLLGVITGITVLKKKRQEND